MNGTRSRCFNFCHVKLFFKFNKYGFVYLIATPLVAVLVCLLCSQMVTRVGLPSRVADVLSIVDFISCIAYGWWFAFEVFRSYPERIDTYWRVHEILLTHNEAKKSVLWALKKKPCGDAVVEELEREFGKLL